MNNMYFCNMMGEEGVRTFRTSKREIMPFENTLESGAVKGFITVKDGKLVVTENEEDENIFRKGLVGEPERLYLPDYKSTLTFKAIDDTEENPLIIVLCKSIKFYDGVPVNIKYIDLNGEAVLACLIYGACEFDGVSMQRCNTQYIDGRKSHEYSSADVSSFLSTLFKDRECGYSYSQDIVGQVETLIKESKSIGSTIKHRMIKEATYFTTEENLTRRQEKERERKEKIELERIRKIEERKARKEAEKARIAEEERKKKDEAFESASVGAAQFLAMIQGMSENN